MKRLVTLPTTPVTEFLAWMSLYISSVALTVALGFKDDGFPWLSAIFGSAAWWRIGGHAARAENMVRRSRDHDEILVQTAYNAGARAVLGLNDDPVPQQPRAN